MICDSKQQPRDGEMFKASERPQKSHCFLYCSESSHASSPVREIFLFGRKIETWNKQNLTFNVTDLKTGNLFYKVCLCCSLLGNIDPSFYVAPIFMKEMQTILYSASILKSIQCSLSSKSYLCQLQVFQLKP